MTIGIAIKPALGDFIVTASDQRQTFQDMFQPVDAGPVKVAHISRQWGFLFAGGQMGYARTIRERANAILGGEAAFTSSDRTFEEAKNAVISAYKQTKDELITHKYLSRYGFPNVEEFRRAAYGQLGPKITERLSEKIEGFDLGMEFLLFGFEGLSRRAHFAEINDRDVVEQTDMSIWAIGTGNILAFGAYNSHVEGDETIETYIYRACEAKFSAEAADAVGKTTSVYVWYPNGAFWALTTKYVNRLRDIWEQDRRRGTPQGAREIIREGMQRDVEFRSRTAMWDEMSRPAPMPAAHDSEKSVP